MPAWAIGPPPEEQAPNDGRHYEHDPEGKGEDKRGGGQVSSQLRARERRFE
jgi:hypothetical protein